MPQYDTKSTSHRSAQVRDIVLPATESSAAPATRKILRAQIVDNVHSREARVKACLLHQRKHHGSAGDAWQDADSFNLVTLSGGQEVRMQLDAAQTFALYRALRDLYAISARGIPRGERQIVVADTDEADMVQGRVREVLRGLVDEHGEQAWDVIDELRPQLMLSRALQKVHQSHCEALAQFGEHLDDGAWAESEWQKFFEANTWIFGYGLDYRFLHCLTPQPHYGGRAVTGQGEQRGDFLMVSSAAARFTVLVEIKTPGSILVTNCRYRNKVYELGPDVVGGVSQLQSNCRTWVTDGARQEVNADLLGSVLTVEPKGILVIGNTGQLAKREQKHTFELFRRNLHNPEIVTYDELFERAQFLVQQAKSSENSGLA